MLCRKGLHGGGLRTAIAIKARPMLTTNSLERLVSQWNCGCGLGDSLIDQSQALPEFVMGHPTLRFSMPT